MKMTEHELIEKIADIIWDFSIDSYTVVDDITDLLKQEGWKPPEGVEE